MILDELKASGVVAVVRGKSHEEARGYMEACLKGGIKSLELQYQMYVSLLKNIAHMQKL